MTGRAARTGRLHQPTRLAHLEVAGIGPRGAGTPGGGDDKHSQCFSWPLATPFGGYKLSGYEEKDIASHAPCPEGTVKPSRDKFQPATIEYVAREPKAYAAPYCLVKTAWMVSAIFIVIAPSWLNVTP
jgi:hypothetical protein